jgi:hypothetical protein
MTAQDYYWHSPHVTNVTVQLLCAPPIVFILQMQVVRDLVRLRKEMVGLADKEGESMEKIEELGYEFLWAWKELRGLLEWLVPGKTENVNMGRAEKIMVVAASGECLVEMQEACDGDGDDEDEGVGEKAFV